MQGRTELDHGRHAADDAQHKQEQQVEEEQQEQGHEEEQQEQQANAGQASASSLPRLVSLTMTPSFRPNSFQNEASWRTSFDGGLTSATFALSRSQFLHRLVRHWRPERPTDGTTRDPSSSRPGRVFVKLSSRNAVERRGDPALLTASYDDFAGFSSSNAKSFPDSRNPNDLAGSTTSAARRKRKRNASGDGTEARKEPARKTPPSKVPSHTDRTAFAQRLQQSRRDQDRKLRDGFADIHGEGETRATATRASAWRRFTLMHALDFVPDRSAIHRAIDVARDDRFSSAVATARAAWKRMKRDRGGSARRPKPTRDPSDLRQAYPADSISDKWAPPFLRVPLLRSAEKRRAASEAARAKNAALSVATQGSGTSPTFMAMIAAKRGSFNLANMAIAANQRNGGRDAIRQTMTATTLTFPPASVGTATQPKCVSCRAELVPIVSAIRFELNGCSAARQLRPSLEQPIRARCRCDDQGLTYGFATFRAVMGQFRDALRDGMSCEPSRAPTTTSAGGRPAHRVVKAGSRANRSRAPATRRPTGDSMDWDSDGSIDIDSGNPGTLAFEPTRRSSRQTAGNRLETVLLAEMSD